MTNYHASFCILGEVVEMLAFREPTPRLLVDISAQPVTDQEPSDFIHRTTFSAFDQKLINELRDRVSSGDVIEATGSFWQLGYVQNKSGVIDTTFRMTGFRLIERKPASAVRHSPYRGLVQSMNLH